MTDLPSFKDKLAADLDEKYPKLLSVIDAALESKKQVWADCPKCSKRVSVEIDDVRGAVEAARFMAEHGHGRPSVANGGSDETERIQFERVIYMGCSNCQCDKCKSNQ